MDRVIDLLQQKNHYLEKFLLMSEAELLNFENKDFGNLESFYTCRDKILNIVNHLDKEFEKTSAQYNDVTTLAADKRSKIERAISRKSEIVSQILELDLKLISCIEAEKSAIIRELRGVNAGRKVLDGYKASRPSEHNLNEEV